jgi:hypothetical protein
MGSANKISNSETGRALSLTGKILCLTFLLLINRLSGQIYNYEPVRHSNFETNPSYMANDKVRFNASLLHIGSAFASNKFYSDALRISVFSKKYFTGLGLTVNNTHLNDGAHYTYFGMGGAYRTVLFGKIYTKLGFMYKIINYKSADGAFAYYSFFKGNDPQIKKRIADNMNISLAFSSSADKYYISGGILNYHLPFTLSDSYLFFPEYYFINAGNLGKILAALNWEISYSAITRKYYGQKAFPLSHYVTVLYDFNLTRRSKIQYCARNGWVDNKYIQFSPMVSYVLYKNRKNYALQLLINSAYDPKTNTMPFSSNIQFNLTCQF